MRHNLNGILAISESLHHYLEQNSRILENAVKASALHNSMISQSNFFASLETSKMLAVKIQSMEINRLMPSPAFELANNVNLSISRLLESTDLMRVNGLLKQVALCSREWEEQLQAIRRITADFPRFDLALQSHLAEISKFSVLSQVKLSQLAWKNLGDALDLSFSIKGSLQNSFLDFTQSYSKLFDSLEKQPSFILSLPPVVSRFPTIEFFNGVNIIDSITVGYGDIESQEENQQIEEIKKEAGDRLEALLGKLNVELIIPLRGARQSLNSTNPDRIRHFATSLRELFTHVLHALSPDEKVKEWSKLPEHYDKGRPTRRARLLYICRGVNHEPFSNFIEKDIDAVLVFLNLFQQGTHEVTSKYTEPQLKVMLVRMESTMRFLLEIWRSA